MGLVQIPGLRTPECQGDIPSQGGQLREDHSVVHHVQVQAEPYQGHF